MRTTRVYTQIYTYKVQVEQAANDSIKHYFKSGLSTLKYKTIRAITISNQYIGVPGQTDQCYLTLVDSQHNTKLYNYPTEDLMDQTGGNVPITPGITRIRLFNLQNIELQNSYFFFTNVTGPISGNIFDINFYFED